MKTSEFGTVRHGQSPRRMGFYLGIGLAGAAGLSLGVFGKTAWQRLTTSQKIPLVLTANGEKASEGLTRAEPSATDKQVIGNAFAEAFGPPAGLPADLALSAVDLPVLQSPEPQPPVVKTQFAETKAPAQAALTSTQALATPQAPGNFQSDVVYFAQPMPTQPVQGINLQLLPGAGCNSSAGLTGLAVASVPLVAPYPQPNPGSIQIAQQGCVVGQCQSIPYIYRRIIGSDGWERIGVDFDNSSPSLLDQVKVIKTFANPLGNQIDWVAIENADQEDIAKLKKCAADQSMVRYLGQKTKPDGAVVTYLEVPHLELQDIPTLFVQRQGADGKIRVGFDTDRIGYDFDLLIKSPEKGDRPRTQLDATHGIFDGLIQQAGFFLSDPPKGDTKQSAGGMGGSAKIGPSAPGASQGSGTLGAQDPDPLVGSFTTEIEDGYLKLPEELIGWVMEAKLYVAPGPDGCLRMSTLDGLEQMFQEEANDALRASHATQMNGAYAANPESNQDRRDRRTMRKFYGLMTACQPEEDEEGNLWIPLGSQLAKQAALKNEVVIVGLRTHVEIWSQQSWEAEITEPKNSPAPKALELQKIDMRKKAEPAGK